MSGALVQTPSNSAADWTDFITQMERLKKGFFNIDFTTMADGAVAPEIEAGSWIESSGNMYLFGTQEAATGWGGIANDTEAWMKVVPAGTSITAEFTDIAPSYNELRNGWYNVDDRYILSVYKDGAGEYTRMGIMPDHQSIWDKNGREVLAMQMETKNNTTGATLAANTEVDVDVIGFSWDPTAVLVCSVNVGLTADDIGGLVQFGGGGAGYASAIDSPFTGISIVSLTCGINKVTVRLRNSQDVSTMYYDNIIVTAVRAP